MRCLVVHQRQWFHIPTSQLLHPVQLFLVWAPSWAGGEATQNYHSSNAMCTFSPSCLWRPTLPTRLGLLKNKNRKKVCAGLQTRCDKFCDVFPATVNAAAVCARLRPSVPPKCSCPLFKPDAEQSNERGASPVQLTPASLNRWTGPERWPPPGSDRSSASSSLEIKKETHIRLLGSARNEPASTSYVTCGWPGTASFPEVVSAGWVPEWLTWRSSPWSRQPCRRRRSRGRRRLDTREQRALNDKFSVTVDTFELWPS